MSNSYSKYARTVSHTEPDIRPVVEMCPTICNPLYGWYQSLSKLLNINNTALIMIRNHSIQMIVSNNIFVDINNYFRSTRWPWPGWHYNCGLIAGLPLGHNAKYQQNMNYHG